MAPPLPSPPSPPENRLPLLRLLQLASPALPVGAFAYSQGLEAAIHAGLVHDEPSATAWILGLLRETLAYQELPIFARVYRAATAGQPEVVRQWNDVLFAMRASAELQMEDRHLGLALARILQTLDIPSPFPAATPHWPPTFTALFAVASAHRPGAAELASAMHAFAFAWAEAQASAAVRLVPLGQSAGVRLLAQAAPVIAAAVDVGLELDDDALGASAPTQAILSAAHETQYSRLFRS
jgi:urease accessory protein